MLKVTNIQKNFNGNHVLKGIDFEINKGDNYELQAYLCDFNYGSITSI